MSAAAPVPKHGTLPLLALRSERDNARAEISGFVPPAYFKRSQLDMEREEREARERDAALTKMYEDAAARTEAEEEAERRCKEEVAALNAQIAKLQTELENAKRKLELDLTGIEQLERQVDGLEAFIRMHDDRGDQETEEASRASRFESISDADTEHEIRNLEAALERESIYRQKIEETLANNEKSQAIRTIAMRLRQNALRRELEELLAQAGQHATSRAPAVQVSIQDNTSEAPTVREERDDVIRALEEQLREQRDQNAQLRSAIASSSSSEDGDVSELQNAAVDEFKDLLAVLLGNIHNEQKVDGNVVKQMKDAVTRMSDQALKDTNIACTVWTMADDAEVKQELLTQPPWSASIELASQVSKEKKHLKILDGVIERILAFLDPLIDANGAVSTPYAKRVLLKQKQEAKDEKARIENEERAKRDKENLERQLEKQAREKDGDRHTALAWLPIYRVFGTKEVAAIEDDMRHKGCNDDHVREMRKFHRKLEQKGMQADPLGEMLKGGFIDYGNDTWWSTIKTAFGPNTRYENLPALRTTMYLLRENDRMQSSMTNDNRKRDIDMMNTRYNEFRKAGRTEAPSYPPPWTLYLDIDTSLPPAETLPAPALSTEPLPKMEPPPKMDPPPLKPPKMGSPPRPPPSNPPPSNPPTNIPDSPGGEEDESKEAPRIPEHLSFLAKAAAEMAEKQVKRLAKEKEEKEKKEKEDKEKLLGAGVSAWWADNWWSYPSI